MFVLVFLICLIVCGWKIQNLLCWLCEFFMSQFKHHFYVNILCLLFLGYKREEKDQKRKLSLDSSKTTLDPKKVVRSLSSGSKPSKSDSKSGVPDVRRNVKKSLFVSSIVTSRDWCEWTQNKSSVFYFVTQWNLFQCEITRNRSVLIVRTLCVILIFAYQPHLNMFIIIWSIINWSICFRIF